MTHTDLRKQHPWVTKDGTDPLLSEEENTSVLVEPPTEEETDQAITGSLGNVMQLVCSLRRISSLSHLLIRAFRSRM